MTEATPKASKQPIPEEPCQPCERASAPPPHDEPDTHPGDDEHAAGEVFVLPTSPAQRRLWFLDRFEPASAAYNIALAYRLEGPVDAAVLARALTALTTRHESLRTTFAVEDEEPVQVVEEHPRVALRVVDLGRLPGGHGMREEDRLTRAAALRPFDLERGPLLRTTLVRRAPERHRFLAEIHHTVADGGSLAVFRRDLAALYRAARSAPGKPDAAALPELPIQYGDYAAWQEEWLAGDEMARQMAYWRDRLAGMPELMELPFAGTRPASRSPRGGRRSRRLPPSTTDALDELARAQGATRFMVYLAAWKLLLHRLGRHADRPDVTVGVPVSGRTLEETEGLIGLFVNTLVLRTDCSGTPSFRGLLGRVKEGMLEALAHQDLPFEKLVEELVPERDLSHEPLVQVSFGLEEGARDGLDLPGVRTEAVETDHWQVKVDLSLLIEERQGALQATISYTDDLFRPTDAERLLRCYETLIGAVARHADLPVTELPVLPAAERHRTLVEWSDGGPAAAPAETLHRLVDLQAESTPEAIAVADARSAVSYGELVRRSRMLSTWLRELGVTAESRVGIALGRSPALVSAMLGVMRAGGAYVPLDPSYPEERLAFMIEDAGIRVLLAQRETAGPFAEVADRLGLRVLLLDDATGDEAPAEARPEPETDPRALAYVIYTSGSTGRPKGVAIAHRNAAAMIRWASDVFAADELSGLFAGTSVNFDLSVFELFVPLARGGRVILGEDVLDLARHPVAAGAAVLVNTVPSAIAELVRMKALPGPTRTVNLAGERLERDLVERIYACPGVGAVYNLYGPSEDTTYSTFERVLRGVEDEPAIGRPIAGTRALVLDRDLRPVPAGVPGVLFLAGEGVARGYLSRPGATAERFLPDPGAGSRAGERAYCTGDLVRFLPDGRLAFLGRLDHQVKLRGFRIELGEIEIALAAHPAVSEAAVLLHRQRAADDRLVAYFAPPAGSPAPSAEALAAHLRQRLPGYMVPAAWVPLDAMPLTPNGKLDRRALAALAPGAGAEAPSSTGRRGPRTPEEEILAELWADLLGVEAPGMRQSFFALGGHSLLATRLLSRVRKLFGTDIPLRRLFEAPTVEALAEAVVRERARGRSGRTSGQARGRIEPVARSGPAPASFAQERLWFLARLGEDGGSYNLPAALELRGALDPPATAALESALAVIVDRHEALRTVFDPGSSATGVLQRVLPEAPVRLARIDLTALAPDRRPAEARRAAAAAAGAPFDLAAGPLFRFASVAQGPEEHLLVVVLHHAVADGWSIGILFRELAVVYEALRDGAPAAGLLPPLGIQYTDFAAWQREWLEGGVLQAQLGHWHERLAGLPPLLDLPTDRPRPAVRSARGGRLPVRLPAPLADGLRRLARGPGASLYMVCLAAFQALLGRLAGCDDLAVGTPIAGRTHSDLEDLIGLFVNTLVLRGDLSGDPSFEALIERSRESALDAYAHQDVPFERLVEELRPERSLGHGPLFQVMLSLQNAFEERPALPGLEARPVEVARETAKFDLRLALAEVRAEGAVGSGLVGEVEFRRDLFDTATVRRWIGQLATLVAAVVEEPHRPLSELPRLPAAERHAVLYEWSRVAGTAAPARAIYPLVARRAVASPDAVAVESAAGHLTYAALVARAERLADRLSAAGAGPERPAAVFLERSPELAVALLAAARAGAPAVPLDPDYPPERLAFMLADSRAPVAVTTADLAGRLPAGAATVLDAEDVPARPGGRSSLAGLEHPDRLAPHVPAYVLYTSGSTGRPNGVAVPQAAVAEHLRAMAEALPLEPGDTVLYKTPASFDPSVWELWAPLTAGARIVMARPGGHREPAYLAEAVARHRTTVLRLVPSLFETMLDDTGFADSRRCPSLRRLFVGGEALPRAAARRFLERAGPAIELINSYGPTETTVTATFHRVLAGDGAAAVPIGRPLGSLRARVLDRDLRPAGIGVPGELVLSGPTLATGYWRRPAATAVRFVPDPHAAPLAGGAGEAGARAYRTGDLVRGGSDGRLTFLGRLDGQVKLRGMRVELGEIESLLIEHPAVERAAARLWSEGSDGRPPAARLAAYAVLRTGSGAEASISAADLREALARRLPAALVPSVVLLLPELPLLPNGKVDRQALPAPEPVREGGDAVPPRGPAEQRVAAVWADVLGVSNIGAHDDFFDLGGHSLLATRVTARLRELTGVELPLRRLFEDRTVAGVAAALEGLRAAATGEPQVSEPPPIAPISRDQPLPASFAQERLWFLDRFGEDRSAYNLPAPRRLRGPLDLRALAAALTDLTRRHESLRTVLRPAQEPIDGSSALQVVRPAAPAGRDRPLPVIDLGGLPAPGRDAALRALASDEARRPFDLAAGPVFRTSLVRLAADDHALLLVLHHVAADGWSMGVLFRELGALYRDAGDLPRLPIQYADYAAWQRRWLSGDVLTAELAFWRERLAGAPPVLDLPTDRARPAVRAARGGLSSWSLPAAATEELRAAAREGGGSLFVALFAGFQALLARVTGATDLSVGTPVANRTRTETEGLIGFFTNTLVLRTDLGGDPTFAELVERVREVALEAFAHQELPFEKLVQELHPERHMSHTPLVQAMLALQNVPAATVDLPGVRAEPVPLDWRSAKFDLTIAVREADGGGLRGQAEFDLQLFDATTVRRLLRAFTGLLEGAATQPDRRLSELPLVAGAERHQLLHEWNDTRSDYPRESLGVLLAARVETAPDAIAATFLDREPGHPPAARALTYGELGRRGARLARRLVDLGAGPDVPVGIAIERSPEMLVGLAGIVATGAAYVPLDPDYPQERLRLMLEDTGAPIVVTAGALSPGLESILAGRGTETGPVRLDLFEISRPGEPGDDPLPPAPGTTPENVACIIYTSGSTGRPKGVQVVQRGIARMVFDVDYSDLAADRRVGLASTLAFDAATFEIWGALLRGATLVGLDRDVVLDPERLAGELARRRVTHQFLTTALFHQLVQSGEELHGSVRPVLGDLHELSFGGEACDPARVRQAAAALSPSSSSGSPGGLKRLTHFYGPSETTTFATYQPVREVPPGAAAVAIGRPIASTTVYVVDRRLRPVPAGVAGELVIGGDGLTRGYHRRPALTADRFGPDPFSHRPGDRLYRSGDLVRLGPAGEIEFLGRFDHQVKIRGFRIELGEIESRLAGHPAVAAQVVVAREDVPGAQRLVAYAVLQDGGAEGAGVTGATLRGHLAASLPDFMVPSAVVILDELPLDPNGKVDRKALPAPEEAGAAGAGGARAGFVPPRGPLEELVAEVWSELLPGSPVGAHDDFFDLGGHSLLATRVTGRLRQLSGVELPLRRLFEQPTVAELARCLEAALADGDEPDEAGPLAQAVPLVARAGDERREDPPASFAQERLWFLGRYGEDRTQYNVPAPLRIEGPLDPAPLARALSEIVRRHEALRTVFARSVRAEAGVVQRVLPAAGPGLPAIDLGGLGAARAETEARRLAAAEAREPFDLDEGPLLRARLVRLGEEQHLLLLTMHHIVTDGWSLAIFFRELETLYGAFRDRRPSPLPELAIQYGDFAAWQRRWLSGARLERQVAYWRGRLAGAPAVLGLPTDRPRPPVQTLRGGELRVRLRPGLLDDLRTLSRRRGVSLFMTLLAGFQTLLGRLAGVADVPVGAPIAGRTRSEVEDLIGFFVNTLVLRGDLAGDPSFGELLARTRDRALDAYSHQDLPFEKLVQELRPERNLTYSPIFQVMFALQNAPPPAPAVPGARSAEPYRDGAVKTAKFDLTLGLAESAAGGMAGDLSYNRDLFDPTTVRRLVAQLETLLASAVVAPDRRLSELALLGPAERHHLLREWNDTALAPPADPAERLLHGGFERRAAERPDAVALVAGSPAGTGGTVHLSYEALDDRASRLARALAAQGVGRGTLVGVHLGRRPETAVAVLAVAKTGGAYVPLETSWPLERIRWIVKERGVRHLLTETCRREAVAGLEAAAGSSFSPLFADDPPVDDPAIPLPGSIDPEDPAYVIFTSGSTGRPKGVSVRHRPAANLVSWVNRSFAIGPEDRILFVTALSFDLSVYDLFGIFAAGGTVRLATGEELDDPVRQVDILVDERITFWDSAPAALQRLAPLFPAPAGPGEAGGVPALRRVFLSGDWVPLTLPDRIRRSFAGAEVVALGGATEATVWSNFFRVGEVDPGWASIPYGRPISNARYHVLDGALEPCPPGVAGDLYIAGGCLSSGYAGSPRQTADSYLPDPFADAEPGAVLYRTGDRARHLPHGDLEFLGRLDNQVKVRGFRIELGEIESVLTEHPAVAEAVAMAREDVPGDQRLVAYLIPSVPADALPAPAELRAWTLRKLPEYMVPTLWVVREDWPVTATGKLDRKALPPPGAEPKRDTPSTGAPASAPTSLERAIAEVWRDVLGIPAVGRDENFFDLGGHSLLLATVQERLRDRLGREIPMVELFRHPSVSSLATALGDPDVEARPVTGDESSRRSGRRPAGGGAVAIVGMAGRFPGARDVEELWRNLRAGVESIRFFSDEELVAAGYDPSKLDDPALVKARGALDDPDLFDAAFFGYSPREAEIIDPQQRLFLETSWQALEDAGYGCAGSGSRRGGDLAGAGDGSARLGVFGGMSESSYLRRLRGDPDLVRTVGGHQIAISNNPDYLASRVSYKLGLTGPSLAVQTACSTSLVAVHLACRSLLEGGCELALAGGASVQAHEVAPYRFVEGGIGSPDGHVRAFDARAGGVVGGSGVGVVVLKRLEDALADGDSVRAVIRGSGVNNDGGLKAGFTAPSAEGQAAVIREAFEAAGVDPASIGYVEAHGTATRMGDPIEVAGLRRAFGDSDGEGPTCALGSVKTNLGHLDAASGVAGLIKAVLVLQHREIPPSLHFESPNPEIDFAGSRFYVADRLHPWERRNGPRRAGVSSFGIGGTNAHLVLEEAPDPEPVAERDGPEREAELLVLSAKTAPALERAAENLAERLAESREPPTELSGPHTEPSLAEVAWTLQAGRSAFRHRLAVVCPRRPDAAEALRTLDRHWSSSGRAAETPPPVVFLFPGQGAQFPGMGASLYREEPVFRDAVDHCAEILAPELGLDLRELLYPQAADSEEAEARLAATEVTQPALFAVEHALVALWASWGVEPAAMAGHSLGEYVAAVRAGVFELDDALRLVAARGRLMASRPGGAMLAVRLGERETEEALAAGGAGSVALAAVNAPDACVVSGPAAPVAVLRERLEASGVGCRPLHTSHAFHSPLMEPVVGAFRELVGRLSLRPPEVPFVSNVTGTWISDAEATDPAYWARHLRSPVRFADGLATVLSSDDEADHPVLLECGPGRTLANLARRHPRSERARAFQPSIRRPRQAGSDRERMLTALGALWVAGVEVDWAGHHGATRPRRVPLPTYPFERRSFWAGADRPQRSAAAARETAAAEAAGRAEAPAADAGMSEIETLVAGAFGDLLGVEPGLGDDFFELGGSSLMAVQLGARLKELAGVELPSDFLLQAASPGELARLIEVRRTAAEAGEAPPESSCLVPLRRSGSRPPLFLVHQVGGQVYSYRPLVQALRPEQPVYALRSPGLEAGEETLPTVEAMAEHYLERVREVRPRGPYRIGGASMGGAIAFEMAHRLSAAGETVELLALMDTPGGDQMPPKPEEDWEITAAVFLGRVRLTAEDLAGLEADEQLRLGSERSQREGSAGLGFEEARRLAAVLRANLDALFAYRPEPWDGQAVFFRAGEKRPGEPPRPERPWIELATGGIEIHVVPGNHTTMHEPPNVEILAERLERSLGRRP